MVRDPESAQLALSLKSFGTDITCDFFLLSTQGSKIWGGDGHVCTACRLQAGEPED